LHFPLQRWRAPSSTTWICDARNRNFDC
jgi:hypothetical protein